MALTVSANSLSIIHKGSKGRAMGTIPNICKTPFPSPPGPLPLPYPSIGESKDLKMGSILTKIEGESVAVFGSTFEKTTGDQPGALGGIVSGTTSDASFFISFSPDVIVESRPVCRKTDQMLMNKFNTVCMSGVMQDDVPGAIESDTEMDGSFIKLTYEYSDLTVIAGAEVEIEFADGSRETHNTDENGEIFLKDLPAEKRGRYTARFKHDPWEKYFDNYDNDYYRRLGLQKPRNNPRYKGG